MCEIFILIIFIWTLGWLFTCGWLMEVIKTETNIPMMLFGIIVAFILWPIFLGSQFGEAIKNTDK